MQHWIIEYENKNIDEIIQFFNQLIIDFETYNTVGTIRYSFLWRVTYV